MKKLIKTFNETGNCEVYTDKVASAWDDRFSISQWKDEYRLIKQVKLFEEASAKVTISKEQAMEIIEKVKLLPIQSMFPSGKTWRTANNIISERNRISGLLKDKTDSEVIRVLNDHIHHFNEALTKAE